MSERIIIRVLLKELIFAEVFSNVIIIHTITNDIKTYMSMDEFSQLLENAIEACKRQRESNKFIIISAGLAEKNIVITVDNSFEGDIIKEEEVFLSSKRKGKGIGVTSVQAIAQKYDGLAKFEYE